LSALVLDCLELASIALFEMAFEIDIACCRVTVSFATGPGAPGLPGAPAGP
jgi:hypothetical protein